MTTRPIKQPNHSVLQKNWSENENMMVTINLVYNKNRCVFILEKDNYSCLMTKKEGMKKTKPLDAKLLRKKLNANQLEFKTTEELPSLTEFVGQDRALEAIQFGIGIKNQGYNLYAMGPSGIGKLSLVQITLKNQAKTESVPADWCYIHNFDLPEKPLALQLPAGMGSVLQQDMKSLIKELSASILAMFESDEYRDGMQQILDDFNLKREQVCNKVKNESKSNKIPHLYKERHEKEKALQLKYTAAVVDPLMMKLKNKYLALPAVLTYLAAVQKDILMHVNDFVISEENTDVLIFSLENPILINYQVNLLVDNGKTKGAPIILEENPTYSNLICRVEHSPQSGALITNLTLIKPGSLHKANGGYLIIEARKLKKSPRAWEGLKRALYSRQIPIEPVEHLADAVRTISLEPMPIPLEIKIILIGDRKTYYSLSNKDPDFNELFKVAVDFDEQINRNKTTIKSYASLIATIAKKEGLRPFHASAVAAIIDYTSRLAEDIKKLSTHIRSIHDLIIEANYWANFSKVKSVTAVEVKQAIAAQVHRLDRTREQYYEDINRDFILINTDGEAIGQVNCLSVVKVGKFSYGHPTRLTAKIRIGKGRLIDIQREIKMAGPMLSKGGLIISNFLASRYNPNQRFSLSASLAFEQIYGTMDGDSASVAELCALLSAIAELPIKQFLAITGSINQYGDVQAIGGVNEKIEGFFDICHARGLNGKQGVLIPTVNAQNLMLRDDIVTAAKQKTFFIYPITTIDQAITILTGLPAGERNKKGEFPKNTVNYKVEQRLKKFSVAQKKNTSDDS